MPLSFTSNEHPDYGVLQVQMHFTTRLRYQDAADLKRELKKQKPICCLSANIMQPLTNSCQQKDGAGFDIASPVLGRVSALQQFQDSHAHDTHHRIGEAAMCSEQNVNYYTDIFTGQLVTNCNSCIDTVTRQLINSQHQQLLKHSCPETHKLGQNHSSICVFRYRLVDKFSSQMKGWAQPHYTSAAATRAACILSPDLKHSISCN